MRKIISLRAEVTSENSSEPQTSHKRDVISRTAVLTDNTVKIKYSYPFDKTYYAIGVLCLLAGAMKFAELIIFVIFDFGCII